MPPSRLCPKPHPKDAPQRAYRLYAETTSPVTHRSTKVAVAAVLCATLGTQVVQGRTVGTYRVERGQHGIVALDAHAFAVARRQSVVATTRAHPAWVKAAKAPTKAKPKARPVRAKAPPPARKARPRPKPRPKPSGASGAARGASAAVPAALPSAEPELTEAGKALLAAAPALRNG